MLHLDSALLKPFTFVTCSKNLGMRQLALPSFGEDNDACLKIATTTQTSFKTRHLRIEFHFILEAIQRKDVYLEYVPFDDNPADMTTKPLRGPAFLRHRATILHLEDP